MVGGTVHLLERFVKIEICSITANTRADGEEFLRLAVSLGITATVTTRPMSLAAATLADLAADTSGEAAVLVPDPGD